MRFSQLKFFFFSWLNISQQTERRKKKEKKINDRARTNERTSKKKSHTRSRPLRYMQTHSDTRILPPIVLEQTPLVAVLFSSILSCRFLKTFFFVCVRSRTARHIFGGNCRRSTYLSAQSIFPNAAPPVPPPPPPPLPIAQAALFC